MASHLTGCRAAKWKVQPDSRDAASAKPAHRVVFFSAVPGTATILQNEIHVDKSPLFIFIEGHCTAVK
jgi:hypothetical protein